MTWPLAKTWTAAGGRATEPCSWRGQSSPPLPLDICQGKVNSLRTRGCQITASQKGLKEWNS